MSESLLNRLNNVKSKLLSQHTIKVKNTWLEECVTFFVSQTQIDDATLVQQVVEQFLLADVIEASNPVIPAQILQKKEAFTQHGTFVLQLLYLIDIGKN
jgi:RecQ mediated genome instability protein